MGPRRVSPAVVRIGWICPKRVLMRHSNLPAIRTSLRDVEWSAHRATHKHTEYLPHPSQQLQKDTGSGSRYPHVSH
ncbi:hypothetical protein ZHAS_00003369 [Anopheles sinensis]|uniref:Uncharacterized protein n=1 Tax=Anopheles sinensis TaxID=74873 RepID=A0A084VE59_ANOSI|nr:hypothetical protein ZHAS_00003369 [Anopheles sinensis]